MSTQAIRWESWELDDADRRRFRLISLQVAVPVIAFAIATLLLKFERPVSVNKPAEIRRYAQLLPPPPPKPPQPVEQPKPEPVVVVPKPEPPKPVKPVEVTPVPVPKPQPTPEQLAAQARDRANKAGLADLSNDLAALRDSQAADSVASGSAFISGTGAAPKEAQSTLGAGRASGGIDTSALGRGTGSKGLADRGTTKVEGVKGGATASAAAKSGGSRSREEVEEIFDRNKGAIYALYNRALRENPALQGKLVLRLTIEPDGTVTSCEVVSSELKDAELERKLIERVKLFKFEARDVAPVTTTKPIDFFPA